MGNYGDHIFSDSTAEEIAIEIEARLETGGLDYDEKRSVYDELADYFTARYNDETEPAGQ